MPSMAGSSGVVWLCRQYGVWGRGRLFLSTSSDRTTGAVGAVTRNCVLISAGAERVAELGSGEPEGKVERGEGNRELVNGRKSHVDGELRAVPICRESCRCEMRGQDGALHAPNR